jgi:hypothetical protein
VRRTWKREATGKQGANETETLGTFIRHDCSLGETPARKKARPKGTSWGAQEGAPQRNSLGVLAGTLT